MNIKELERELCSYGIEDGRGETYLIVERLFGVSRASLVLDRERDFASAELDELLKKRKDRIPLQYIFGDWEFMGKKFFVSEDCLIPQPDTEILTEKAIEILKKWQDVVENAEGKMKNTKLNPNIEVKLQNDMQVADLCTGSGCIAISTLAHRPDCKALAVDLFPETLALARHNAERNGVADRLKFQQADVLDPRILDGEAPFDAILSNPPYIPSTTVDTLDPELAFEPRAALDGGEDGLIFYRAIVKNFAQHLTPKGFILFEIGYDQEQALKAIAASCGFVCSVERDLAGNPRVARLDRRKDHYGTNH